MGKDGEEDDLAGDSQRWAADEETAMWDESAMRESGFGDLAKDREAKPREETGPATGKDFGGDDKAKVKLSRDATGSHDTAAQKPPAQNQPAPPAPKGGPSTLSWVVTIAVAIVVGVAVFYVVRMIVG